MMIKETEVRFLEIDKSSLVERLLKLGAHDLGETVLEEAIIYDKGLRWLNEKRLIRIRKTGPIITLTYKEHMPNAMDGAHEIELAINDMEKGIAFLEQIGYTAYRRQQKKRHTLHMGEVIIDIDTWPRIPSYVELEGPSMQALEDAAKALGLDWAKVVYEDARWVIENVYHFPLGTMRWFTFDKFE